MLASRVGSKVVGMCADDVKGLTVVVGCPWVVAASLGDRAETFMAFWEIGEALEQITGYPLGLIEGAASIRSSTTL